MKLLLKSVVIMSLLLLAFSCSEDDPEHYLRVVNKTGDIDIHTNIENTSLSFSANGVEGGTTFTGYKLVPSSRNYNISMEAWYNAELERIVSLDTTFTEIPLYDPNFYEVDTMYSFDSSIVVFDTTWTYQIGTEFIFDDDSSIDTILENYIDYQIFSDSTLNTSLFYAVDGFSDNSTRYWSIVYEKEAINEVDEIMISIEDSRPQN